MKVPDPQHIMENNSRRAMLKQVTFFSLGSSFLLESCSKNSTDKGSLSLPQKPLKPVYIPAGTFPKAPDNITFGDGVMTGPKIRSEYTNGQLCCQEMYLKPKQAGPPPHLHKELDEVMRVLEGTLHVLVGDTVTEVHAGDWHVRPHGIVHTFWNAGEVPARAIDLYPNQDFLSYFDEMVRINNNLKSKGLTEESAAAKKAFDELDNKFGIVIFFDKFPAIIEKYGLIV